MKEFLKGAAGIVGMLAVVAVFAGGAYLIKHPPQPQTVTFAPAAGYTDVVPSPTPSPTADPNRYDVPSGAAPSRPAPTAAAPAAPTGPVMLPAPNSDTTTAPPPDHPELPADTSVWIGQGTYTVEAGQPVTLTAKLQNGWPGVAVTYKWGGDLAGKTGASVTVTFSTPGTYHATVTAYQDYSGFTYQVPSTGLPTQIVVSAPPPAPSPVPSPVPSPDPTPSPTP